MSKFQFPLWLLFIAVWIQCETQPRQTVHRMQGQTMGTTYHITLIGGHVAQTKIDSLLTDINQSLSTYIDTSLISQFNQSDTDLWVANDDLGRYLKDNLLLSQQIFSSSDGLFDPTVMPLVNLWGFGYQNKNIDQLPDSNQVDSILNFVGLNHVSFEDLEDGFWIKKEDDRTQLDFSAVAKGYGIDVLHDFFEKKGILSWMIEIGGEVRCNGLSPQGKAWNIGINIPSEDGSEKEFQTTVSLKNEALATSGNYRNYSVVEGVKVSHSIHPIKGVPERNSLLSATIVAPTCALADAMATACMISGLEKSKSLVDAMEDVEAFFIFGLPDGSYGTWKTEGFAENE